MIGEGRGGRGGVEGEGRYRTEGEGRREGRKRRGGRGAGSDRREMAGEQVTAKNST